MFSQVSVCPQWGGGMRGRGCAWQGAYMAGGASVAGGMQGRGCAWQGVCVAGGTFMAGGACLTGEMATAAGGTHPTGMHSCSLNDT